MILKPKLFRKPRLSHPLARGLVGYWLMNEGSGNKVFDLSGNGLHLTAGGTPEWKPGPHGSCIEFDDASSEYFQIDSCPITDYPYTLVAYGISDDSSNNAPLLWIGDSGENTQWSGISLVSSVSLIRAYSYGPSGGGYATASGCGWGNWYFVVGVYNSSTSYSIYVNGIYYATQTTDTGSFNYNRIGIARRCDLTPTANLSGQISYAMLYNRALSTSEITKLCQKPFCMFERDLIELWSAATLGAAPPVGMSGAMTTNPGYWGW